MDLVIAHYDEDLGWVDEYKDKFNIKVYSKGPGGDLPNVGCQEHTYLHHIITHYDEGLANLTFFCPGSVMLTPQKRSRFDVVMKNVLEHKKTCFFVNHAPDLYNFTIDEWSQSSHGDLPKELKPCPIRPFGKWFSQVIPHKSLKDAATFTSVFAVEKATILETPKSVYETMLEFVRHDRTSEACHYVERAWYSIFV